MKVTKENAELDDRHTSEGVDSCDAGMQASFDEKLFSESQVYCLEMSVDILRLYANLNELEVSRAMMTASDGSNSSMGLFPDDLHHGLSLPNSDGGSVTSYLSPLSASFSQGNENRQMKPPSQKSSPNSDSKSENSNATAHI